MKLQGSAGQVVQHPLYRADGSITSGGTAQLVLPVARSRSFLYLQNISNGPLWFEFGPAVITCSITNGVVTGTSIVNAGFGYTLPPVIRPLGGATGFGIGGSTSYLGVGQPGYPAPSRPAQLRTVLSGNAVNAVTIIDPGAGYVQAPFLYVFNDDLDPYGAAAPANNVGMMLDGGSAPLILNGTACTTDAIAVWGASTNQKFVCRWMD
jgi:hypothetical protein